MNFNEMNEKYVKLKRKRNHIFGHVMFLGFVFVSPFFSLLFLETYGSFYIHFTAISGIIGVAVAAAILPIKCVSARIPFCFVFVISFYTSTV